MSTTLEIAIAKVRRGESVTREDALAMTFDERLSVQWEMTKREWGITDETPMRRDIVRVIRPSDSAD